MANSTKLRLTFPGETKIRVGESSHLRVGLSEKPKVEIRDIVCLGTCLPGWEGEWHGMGGNSWYANRLDLHNFELIRRLKSEGANVGVFICLGANNTLNESDMARQMDMYIDIAIGWWMEALGHEPDICGQSIEERIRWYEFIRSRDPDKQARPVMEMFNMTSVTDFQSAKKDAQIREWEKTHPTLIKIRMKSSKKEGYGPHENDFRRWVYPGWENAYDERCHDVVMIDFYCQNCDDNTLQYELNKAFGKFVNKFALNRQLIPQLGCFRRDSDGYLRENGIWRNYTAWRDLLGVGGDWNNPYQGTKSMAFYKWETICSDAEIQNQVRRIITDIRS